MLERKLQAGAGNLEGRLQGDTFYPPSQIQHSKCQGTGRADIQIKSSLNYLNETEKKNLVTKELICKNSKEKVV